MVLPLPEAIRLSLREASESSDAKLLRRTYDDILVSLAGPPGERVGKDVLVLCAETALKVNVGSGEDSYHLSLLLSSLYRAAP